MPKLRLRPEALRSATSKAEIPGPAGAGPRFLVQPEAGNEFILNLITIQ